MMLKLHAKIRQIESKVSATNSDLRMTVNKNLLCIVGASALSEFQLIVKIESCLLDAPESACMPIGMALDQVSGLKFG